MRLNFWIIFLVSVVILCIGLNSTGASGIFTPVYLSWSFANRLLIWFIALLDSKSISFSRFVSLHIELKSRVMFFSFREAICSA